MADEKISVLTETTTLVDADIFPVVTGIGGTPQTKYIKSSNVSVEKIRESGGTTLTVGAISDGQNVVRSGSTLIGSSTASADMLSTLTQTEVSVTGTATATIGKWHVCSGTSSDYTLTLPAASGNAGNFVGVRGATALTKKVTIDGNASELINGVASLQLQAGNSYLIMCDGTGWYVVAQRGMIGAWVTLNGTGTIAILASHNVSSIVDNSTGRYTVNFVTAFQDANYCVQIGGTNSAANRSASSITTTSCQINFYENGVGYVDVNPATALFVR
jgi:hypothetical protein